MRATTSATLFGILFLVAAAQAAEPDRPAPLASQTDPKTGKERLSDKATDEQRVDDCKVAPERRTRARSTVCPWDARS